MSLPAVAGNSIYASDLYQLCQPSGGQEKGTYWLGGNVYTTGGFLNAGVSLLSRNATPVSVSIDTTIQAPTGNLNSPNTATLNSSGFHVYASTSAATGNCSCGGNYTVQF